MSFSPGEAVEQDSKDAGEGTKNGHDGSGVECNKLAERSASDEDGKVRGDVSGVLIVKEEKKRADDVGESVVHIDRKDLGKRDGNSDDEECMPPALPPRPPPRSRQVPSCSCTCDFPADADEIQRNFHRPPSRSCWASGLRKYVFLCTACGSLSILLGTLFLTVYFMLKSYTSSLNHFETIPTYVPAGMLIATGFLIICLTCRKNRNSFLMKLCGLCSLCCAVLCVSVTVTTTVIHMNRLQTLRECLYTQKTQSCTCYSVLMDNDRTSDEGIKFVFNSTPDCEVVHGALYSCLRAIFGLSVIGILVCIFSCMLVYQLLSHEKKKMYWAQLEMRCRYLYRQQRNPHYCSCCDECRYPPPPHEIFPWELMGNRFWSSGRIGNLYTPNPEDRESNSRLRSGWNWRRLPWNRSGSNTNEPSRANLGSPDSQYGFSSTPTVDGAPYTVLDPRTTNCSAVPPGTDITEGGFYSWGPPPPYASNRNSANNSPARRSLGEILHQVSPIRRNDNVSPIRPYHHVHHHHMHHPHPVNHQCGSSSRQIAPSNMASQSNCLQKSAPSRAIQGTDMLQQQQRNEMGGNLRSNSLTSVHRFHKMDQNKDNYENTYETDNFPSSNGFNTLPSLKKRNQTRASDLFQNETTSAYYFSSAENLGCSESNTGNERHFRNENLPPRVFLMSDTSGGSGPRCGSGDGSGFQNQQLKGETELQGDHSRISNDSNLMSPRSSSVRPAENGNSFVKKLFVSCSPTKANLRSDGDAPMSSSDKRDAPMQFSKRKIGKRTGMNKDVDSGNENVITFHYRLGIPRSPNIQNFGQIADGSLKSCNNEDSSIEQWSNENANDPDELADSQKMLKGFKYVAKDIDLLQKHGSLMKEFSKNVDLQKNLKLKSEKSPGSSIILGGVDNKGFQNAEDCSVPATRLHPSGQDYKGSKSSRMDFGQNDTDQVDEYPMASLKTENESDLYFGDISNSSCYLSVANEGGDSSLYEEPVEPRGGSSSLPTPGQSLLNKQNLKRIEDEAVTFSGIEYELPDNQVYGKHPGDGDYQPGYKARSSRSGQFRYGADSGGETKKDESQPGPSDFKSQDAIVKSQRRMFIPNYNEAENKVKYFSPIASYQEHYRPPEAYQEASNSNDEHSSSSLTVDSGISTGRNYHSRFCDTGYQELDMTRRTTNGNDQDGRADPSFEPVSERSSTMDKFQPCKISNLENLGDFSHPLFQKPKVLPRGNRYKEIDMSRHKKAAKSEFDRDADGDGIRDGRKMRSPFQGKPKATEIRETFPGQHGNEPELERFDHSKSIEDTYSKQKVEEGLRKSPKPLPRTSVTGSDSLAHGKHGKYAQSKEKHFLAPDAQYGYKSEFKHKQGKKDPGKPMVPTRPLNLQERCRNSNFMLRDSYCKTDTGCPLPRRRQQHSQQQQPQQHHLQQLSSALGERDDTSSNEISSHSVKV